MVRKGQINPDLRVPQISNPSEESETNLHGDIEGSPYSTTPGEISLADAEAREQEAATTVADDADTREREIESRKTGGSAETHRFPKRKPQD